MELTLYRRHTAKCIKKYAPNKRILFPTTKKTRIQDCDCPIAAEGKLSNKGRITNRSLHTSDWFQAQETAKKWEEWGSTIEPLPKDPTVQYAVTSFLTSQGPQGRNIEPSTYRGFDILLNQRLLPFAKSFSSVRAFDNLDTATKFVESWINLKAGGPLADSTKKTELERLRFFFNYCVDREWLANNAAKKIKHKFHTAQKFGLSSEEEKQFFDAIKTPDLRAFCLTMRYGGLRISDATVLDASQLVTRASGEGWALKLFQKKTKEWMYVPIPATLAETLHALPFKAQSYWFWTGNGNPESAKVNWYHRIKAIIDQLKFSRPVSPHTLRHTFAISHLNAGVDLKFVSRWCGHKSITVTEKHYAHAIRGTLVASDNIFNASETQQLAISAKTDIIKL